MVGATRIELATPTVSRKGSPKFLLKLQEIALLCDAARYALGLIFQF